MSRQPTVVVLGMLTKMPVAGIVWLTIPYLVALRRLGYEPYYVEAHARTPSMLMRHADDDGSLRAATYVDSVMERFGFGDRWAYHALHDDGRVYGLGEHALKQLYRSADLILNLHGGTDPRPEHVESGRLVLVETDPVQLEIELFDGDRRAWSFLESHCAAFTWGENYGNADCKVPIPEGIRFRPTRMPMLLDAWRNELEPGGAFTTIGNWEQTWRDLAFLGETYSWSKHHEFLKVIDLPRRTGTPFELALASCTADARDLLVSNGWSIRDADTLSADLDAYRRYISSSFAEFTVAKDQNVRLRSGWFSDRSASYLAAGRPVITQETGFSNALPSGEGLFGFSTLEDAAAAVEAIHSDWRRHSRAALDIAREYFDAERVLREMLTELGLPAFPPSLSLVPISRAPTTLDKSTVAMIAATGLPTPKRRPQRGAETTAVVVTVDGLEYTRLCLEGLLGDPALADLELVVVDNCSTDGTLPYLEALAQLDARVRVIANETNVGFAAAVNQGLSQASGQFLVLMNNDVIVPPGGVGRLIGHLRDLEVGLAGPVSNRAASEAEIECEYKTLADLFQAAELRWSALGGQTTAVDSLTMFCTALRREVYEAIGPLDESFGLGLFEDDDYAVRVRRAKLRIVCAEGVLVHHFGEASFGHLVPSGEYSRLFEANRRKFEEKWGRPWRERARRHNDDYAGLVCRVRQAVLETIPADASVLVLTRGDADLLELGGRRAGHFPQLDGGVYAGYYPADAGEAVTQLESLRADFLVVPRTAAWWLDHYDGLRHHLAARCIRANDDCSIYDLAGTA
jgi:GT2 family glycosyltransferase